MSSVATKLSADQWFQRWQQLSTCRKELGAKFQAKHQEALVAGGYCTADGARIFRESDALWREYEIAHARAGVAWARYVIAKHRLADADVLDVEPH